MNIGKIIKIHNIPRPVKVPDWPKKKEEEPIPVENWPKREKEKVS